MGFTEDMKNSTFTDMIERYVNETFKKSRSISTVHYNKNENPIIKDLKKKASQLDGEYSSIMDDLDDTETPDYDSFSHLKLGKDALFNLYFKDLEKIITDRKKTLIPQEFKTPNKVIIPLYNKMLKYITNNHENKKKKIQDKIKEKKQEQQ